MNRAFEFYGDHDQGDGNRHNGLLLHNLASQLRPFQELRQLSDIDGYMPRLIPRRAPHNQSAGQIHRCFAMNPNSK